MMNKTRQMISLNGDTYQYIQNYMIEQKMRYLGGAIADICNRSRYEQKKEWDLTIITEAASSIIFLTCCIGWFFLTLFTKKDYKKSPYPEEPFAIIIENIPINKSTMSLKNPVL